MWQARRGRIDKVRVPSASRSAIVTSSAPEAETLRMYSFRLGLLGFAASPALLEDNKAAGDEGVGNYGKPRSSDFSLALLMRTRSRPS